MKERKGRLEAKKEEELSAWAISWPSMNRPSRLAMLCIQALRTTIMRLHDAGIEVILDVVYNHTAEGNHLGPTLCFRGIDNRAYYRVVDDEPQYYMDYTGTGNSLNVRNPHALQLLMDSLRYWVLEMHVDGFRFDLASALAREFYDVDRLSSFFELVQQDPSGSARHVAERLSAIALAQEAAQRADAERLVQDIDVEIAIVFVLMVAGGVATLVVSLRVADSITRPLVALATATATLVVDRSESECHVGLQPPDAAGSRNADYEAVLPPAPMRSRSTMTSVS